MNFRVDEKDNHFEALINSLVPTVIYTNQTSWIKYGYRYTGTLIDKLPDASQTNNATGLRRKLLDLLYSEYELFEELGLYTTSVSQSLSDECDKREVTLEGVVLDNIAQLAEIFKSTATHLTRIPFSFFSHKLITILKNHSMLEVTLQIMQQFELQLKEPHIRPNYNRMVGDKSMSCVRCKKCQQDITPHGDITSTLKLAPAAMMKHMKLDFAGSSHWPILQENDDVLEQCLESFKSYQPPLCKESNDRFTFGLCEALKIDINLQYGNDKDTKQIVANTFSFLQVMFEDIIPADEPAITEKENDHTDTDDIEDDYVLQDYIIENLMTNTSDDNLFNKTDQDRLPAKLKKGWNLFFSRLYLKNLEDICLFGAKLVTKHDSDNERGKEALKKMLQHLHLKHSVNNVNKLWDRERTTNDTRLHEQERPFPHEMTHEKLCVESVMNTTGPGWTDVGKKKYFPPGSLKKVGSLAKTKAMTMTSLQDCEEANILLRTSKKMRKYEHDDGSIHFQIKCFTKDYETNNTELRKRHGAIFREDTFKYFASNDLVQSMRYSYVDGLDFEEWTDLERDWLTKVRVTLTKAENLTIHCIQLVRIRGSYTKRRDAIVRVRLHPNYVEADKSLTNKWQWYHMTLNELNKLIGDKRESCPWSSGEMANLVMIGSNIMVTLSLGATRKDSHQIEISEGDSVLVTGFGDYWKHKATVVEVDKKNRVATVQWDDWDRRQESIPISTIVGKSDMDLGKRKRSPTDFYSGENVTKRTKNETTTANLIYSENNPLNLCTEGAVCNLLILLGYEREQVDDFLRICRLPIVQVMSELQETSIPHKVWSKTKYTNKIQLVLWILRKKIKFETTSPLKTESLKQIHVAFDILTQFKFPLLISASAKETQYSHVVVVWDNKIIDYESRTTRAFTKDNLSKLCGT